MTKPRAECSHEVLRFGSGDYYVSDGTLPKGEFKQNERGFYHFYPATGAALSAHDCRRVAAMLKAFNTPDKRK